MKEYFLPALFASAILLACLACSDPAEFATFEAEASQPLPSCMADQFPLELELLAAQTRTDRVGIFLQTAPDIKSRSDIVYFELYHPEEVSVDDVIELSPAAVPPPMARGKLSFFSSCPYEHLAFDIFGTLNFDNFDHDHGGVISGRLEEGYAVDSRTEEVMIQEFTGSFSFIVRAGPPYEDFYALPERPQPGDF